MKGTKTGATLLRILPILARVITSRLVKEENSFCRNSLVKIFSFSLCTFQAVDPLTLKFQATVDKTYCPQKLLKNRTSSYYSCVRLRLPKLVLANKNIMYKPSLCINLPFISFIPIAIEYWRKYADVRKSCQVWKRRI